MTNLPKVLIFSPNPENLNLGQHPILQDVVEIITKTDLFEAQTWFTDNEDPDIMVIVANDPEIFGAVKSWVEIIRRTFKNGTLIAVSQDSKIRQDLIDLRADYGCKEHQLAEKILESLSFKIATP